MGTYTSLYLAGYELVLTKRYPDPAVMSVFCESDKYRKRLHEAPDGILRVLDKDVDSLPKDLQESAVGYAAPVAVVRDRLDVMGFTEEAARSEFSTRISARLRERGAWLADSNNVDGNEWLDRELRILEGLTFDVWLGAFSELMRRRVYSWQLRAIDGVTPQVSPLQEFMLTEEELFLGFPSVDIRHVLRATLMAAPDKDLLIQDLSAVIEAGYLSDETPATVDARQTLLSDFPVNAPIVVLTEGSTDRFALQGALRLLYPHLVDYYTFMDFDAASVPGGTGPLVATVKAFSGACIANRVVALFDNDTAGQAAVRSLQRVTLLPSIRVRTYPPIPAGEDYPTIGPSGLVNMNINGMAGSIELYFGDDVLRNSDGTCTPVQWKGFDPSMRQYQGELLDKSEIQARFRRKLGVALDDPSLVAKQDWEGMRAILDSLRAAFHSS